MSSRDKSGGAEKSIDPSIAVSPRKTHFNSSFCLYAQLDSLNPLSSALLPTVASIISELDKTWNNKTLAELNVL